MTAGLGDARRCAGVQQKTVKLRQQYYPAAGHTRSFFIRVRQCVDQARLPPIMVAKLADRNGLPPLRTVPRNSTASKHSFQVFVSRINYQHARNLASSANVPATIRITTEGKRSHSHHDRLRTALPSSCIEAKLGVVRRLVAADLPIYPPLLVCTDKKLKLS